MSTEDKSLETQIRELLKGIDADECRDPEGWWETSTGAEFGAGKLRELLALVEASRRTYRASVLEEAARECEEINRTAAPHDTDLATACAAAIRALTEKTQGDQT